MFHEADMEELISSERQLGGLHTELRKCSLHWRETYVVARLTSIASIKKFHPYLII